MAKYAVGDKVICRVDGVTFTGVIEQVGHEEYATVYHVEAKVQGTDKTWPLFVQEAEIVGRQPDGEGIFHAKSQT